MKIARSLASVLAGYAVMVGIVRIFGPPVSVFSMNLFVASLASTIGGAIVGGFTAAWLAGNHEIPHGAGVGLLMIISIFVSMQRQGVTRLGWYETTLAGCGPISAMFGAAIRMLVRHRQK